MNEDYYFEEVTEDDEELAGGFDNSGVESGEFDDGSDFDESDLRLGFIRYIGKESGGVHIYEFMFTAYPDDFYGENFNYMPAGICNGIEPDGKYIQRVVTVRTIVELCLIQDSGCFSMQDCMDGIVALAYEDLTHLDEYPEDGRIYFMFGESYEEVERKWAVKHVIFGGI